MAPLLGGSHIYWHNTIRECNIQPCYDSRRTTAASGREGAVTQKSKLIIPTRVELRAQSWRFGEVEWVPVERSVLDCSGSLVVDASGHHNLHRRERGWSTMYVKGGLKDGRAAVRIGRPRPREGRVAPFLLWSFFVLEID